MKQLITKSCDEIMTTVYKPIEFVVEGLLAQGLYILAGAPKVGKSWLVLDMCLSIAKGEEVLGRKTSQGAALYLCLEDSYSRIQNRLYELTDEPSENLYFSVLAENIGNGLEEQIEQFKLQHDDLKIVAIDTLQKIKSDEEYSYGTDYAELSVLKKLAEKLNICILIVHHTRKCHDADPFNMISGTTGISGCVDGSMVLMKSNRTSSNEKLFATGRDIEESEIHLEIKNCKWVVTDEQQQKEIDIFPFAIHDLMVGIQTFKGTATELCRKLKESFDIEIQSNVVSKKLLQNVAQLEKLGVKFELKRSHGKRWIEVRYDCPGDSGDGKIQCATISCPAGTRPVKSIENACVSLGDGKTQGDGKLPNSDGNFFVWNGRKIEIYTASFRDVLKQD